MKKTIAVLLAILTILSISLAGCNGTGKGGETSSTTDEGLVVPGGTTTTPVATTPVATTTTPAPLSWTEKSDTIYVLFDANLRSDSSTSSDAKGYAKFGDELSRTAVSTDGSWCKVNVNGSELYIYAALTTDNKADVTFPQMTEKKVYVNVNSTMNLRTTPCYYDGFEANLGTAVKRGVELTLISINESGNWAKVKFEDKIYYCRPANLSDTVPSEVDTSVPANPQG